MALLHLNFNRSSDRIERITVHQDEMRLEIEETMGPIWTAMDGTEKYRYEFVLLVRLMFVLVEMLNEKGELFESFLTLWTIMIAFEKEIRCLRDVGNGIDVVQTMREMRMQGTGIDAGKWFTTYWTNLEVDREWTTLLSRWIKEVNCVSKISQSDMAWTSMMILRVLTIIESMILWVFRFICTQLRRTQWWSVIVTLSVKYSVADRWSSVWRCRIILSSSARVQWQMSQT